MKERASGILLPVFSLPSDYGIGTFGKEAYEFIDILNATRQKYWQVLPLCPTGYGDSPYQSFSTFAGNPYFIDLDILVSEDLLSKEECDEVDFGSNNCCIEYVNKFISFFAEGANAIIRRQAENRQKNTASPFFHPNVCLSK
jgi:4-alpha-glucanotransferase